MNAELHLARAHHYMSMLYVLTCNAAERQRPEHFLHFLSDSFLARVQEFLFVSSPISLGSSDLSRLLFPVMSSRSGPRAAGTDGGDYTHREIIKEQYYIR